MTDHRPSNELAARVLEIYGPTLRRMRDGTHFDHCWQDHWGCVLDMCLAEIERLQRELAESYTESEVMTFIGFLSASLPELSGVEMGRFHTCWDDFLNRAGLADGAKPPPPTSGNGPGCDPDVT